MTSPGAGDRQEDMRKATSIWRLICLAAAMACGWGPWTAAGATESLAVAFVRNYSPLETDKLYRGYLEHLKGCTGLALTNHFGQSLFGRLYAAETVAESQMAALLLDNRLQVALVPSGLAAWLSARGVTETVATRGQLSTGQPETFQLLLLVRADNPVGAVGQLAGTKIGFPHSKPASGTPTAPLDASGAPILNEMLATAALGKAGLGGKDYTAQYSGGHERALVGLQTGFWQAAFIASDQFDRMVKKREARERDFRVLWRSAPLPTESIVVLKSLSAGVKSTVAKCTHAHRFSAEQARLFEGSDAFLPSEPGAHEAYRQLLLEPPAAR